MQVLITGVAGFIGSNLAAAHLKLGHQVTGIDNFSTGHKRNLLKLPELKLIEKSLLDSVEDFPAEADVVYHLASPASPEKYVAQPWNTIEVNTTGTRALLEYSHQVGARMIFASTSEVYGDPLVSPQSEQYWGNVNPIGPRSVYDEAKRFGETLVSQFQRERRGNAAIVRIFNTYGPRMDPYDGRVVSNFIRQALQGTALTIYGTGQQTRSFCYIDDLVRGLMAMGLSSAGGPINLGNPGEMTLLELAQLVVELLGGESKIEFLPLPQDDPQRRNPDISRALEELGWQPTESLSEGLIKTAHWMKELL